MAGDDDIIGFGSSFQLVLSEVMSPKLKLTARLMMIDSLTFFSGFKLVFCSFHSGQPRQLHAISLAYQQSQITGTPSPCRLGWGWEFRARGDLEMGPKKDIPSCLLQRLGQRDKLYQTSKHMHWICYSGARKVMCSAGVTVCKEYLI